MSHSQRPEGDQRQCGATAEGISVVQRGDLWLARNEVESFREALDTLESLGILYRIGAITNGNADVLSIGTEHRFDFVVRSERAGVSKPLSDIFLDALDHPRVPAAQVLHLGDDPEGDLRGAAAVGMRTAWVNAAGAAWSGEGPLPDATIRRLDELGEAISSLWGAADGG